MSDLDEKLREILYIVDKGQFKPGWSGAIITQIKQVFTDEGYAKPLRLSKDKAWELCVVCSKPVSDGHVHDSDLMTGQEWYDRYVKELADEMERLPGNLDLLAPAKRAAGLTEGGKQ